jgi:hypothetical protein
MSFRMLVYFFAIALLSSCNKFRDVIHKPGNNGPSEDPSRFAEIGSIDIGNTGAAEISAFDPKTRKLFVVNNSAVNKIDVIDLKNPASPVVTHSILSEKYGGLVNSVSVAKGLLAAAIESKVKTEPGKVVVFNTSDYSEVKVVPVGALPDMVTFSPDGKYILTANEGEPSADYLQDPVGSVSIISVKQEFAVRTLDFSSLSFMQASLQQRGFRIFGPGASFAQDIEPEYVTVSDDSRTAWVTLQENNGIARIDIPSAVITQIFPLGFKSYSENQNGIDPSDRDNTVLLRPVPVKGMFQPDAIAVWQSKFGAPMLVTANEGDVREYDAFEENERVKDLTLDASTFPNAADLQTDAKLGRLNVTKTLGDANTDGSYESLYSFGARSFSVWNGTTGQLVFDSKNQLEEHVIAAGFYDDARSDDKGVEPEGLTLGEVSGRQILFVGLERADAVAIYELKTDGAKFLQILRTGDAPEGVLFISAKDSPTKSSLLVISSEGDGVVKIYEAGK